MKKNQLISALADFPDDIDILVSSDSEGNSYSSLEFVDQMFTMKSFIGGNTEEVFSPEDIAGEDVDDPDEYMDAETLKEVLVFWP